MLRTQSVSEGDEDCHGSHHLHYSTAYSGLADITSATTIATNYNNNLDVETAESQRDDKYWERRR